MSGDTLHTPSIEETPIETLKAVLSAETAESVGLRQRYAERLLEHTLRSRDADTALLMARAMDADPALDEALYTILSDMLYSQPDAVYAFARARVSAQADPKWLARLKIAALFSLRIAINDGDTATLINWLTLIAREPPSYELGDVLHYGMLAAQARAAAEPDLARHLVILAVKRSPATLESLLDDAALLAALPDNLGAVLRDFQGDPLLLLQNKGPELFLVALARAARARASALFTPVVIAQFWELFLNGQATTNALPQPYRAESIIQEFATSGALFLSSEALETLLTLMLAGRRDDLAQQVIHQMDGARILVPVLAAALENSQRTIHEALDLIGQVLARGDMTPQQVADLYMVMLDGLEWRKEALPLAQQLARTLQQYPALTVETDVLWRMLSLASETRDEQVGRAAIKRLLADLETTEDEAQLSDDLRRIHTQTQWSDTARQIMVNWWRGFIRQQALNRLQRLDKALEGKRLLDEERAILQTLLAVRRMLGPRSLTEFAKGISVVYETLQALAESFDPNSRRQTQFDQDILRAELEAHQSELSPQERQILANNLKEVAQLIAEMGDNRTKANLMRRGDELDRDLMSGDQSPHSAVDAMKWLAGFWGGTEKDED